MRGEKVRRECRQCGKGFMIYVARVKAGCGHFCSPECQTEASKRRVQLTCVTCGQSFEIHACRVGNRGQGKFCSRKCTRYEPRESNTDRLARLVVIPKDDPNSCWGWLGSTLPFGYGQIRDSKLRRQVAAHILSYRIHKGPIPRGKFVLHSCDNPPCTNPQHLFLGTKKQNSEDMVSKRRSAAGEKHFNSILTESDVREIRELAAIETSASMAIRFGVSRPTVDDAIRRRTWKHV